MPRTVARAPGSAAPPGSATAEKKRGSRTITRAATPSASDRSPNCFSNTSAARVRESSTSRRTWAVTTPLR